jgi:1,4-alpha-glucan branching enzyme
VDGDAETVTIEGDFNSWDGGNDVLLDVDGRGLWQRVITLKSGRHSYRFVADGTVCIDVNNDRTEYLEGRGIVSVTEV